MPKLIQGVNDLLTLYPEIAAEWDQELNNLSASQVAAHTGKTYMWMCPNGHPSYSMSVSERTRKDRKGGCPLCGRYKRQKLLNEDKKNKLSDS